MKAVYLVGEPGTGKTTLMNRLLATYDRQAPVKLDGTLMGEPLRIGQRTVGLHLGTNRAGGFGGTDALAMNVHPVAVAWASSSPLPPRVYAEGQRLGTVAFLRALAARGSVTLALLQGEEVAAARRAQRGSTQSESFIKGARTRAANLAERAPRGVTVLTLDAELPVEELARRIREVA